MGRIISPTHDEDRYSQIRDLANIKADSVVIDNNILFQSAESFIITAYPNAIDRDDDHREDVENALVLLTGSYFKKGGGTTAQGSVTTQGSGDVKSKSTTIGRMSETISYDVGASSKAVNNIGSADSAEFLESQAFDILRRIGANIGISTDIDVGVGLTESRL